MVTTRPFCGRQQSTGRTCRAGSTTGDTGRLPRAVRVPWCASLGLRHLQGVHLASGRSYHGPMFARARGGMLRIRSAGKDISHASPVTQDTRTYHTRSTGGNKRGSVEQDGNRRQGEDEQVDQRGRGPPGDARLLVPRSSSNCCRTSSGAWPDVTTSKKRLQLQRAKPAPEQRDPGEAGPRSGPGGPDGPRAPRP